MKTIRLFFCGALLLFIGSASLSAETNLIPNGGFETLDTNGLPSGWTISDGDTLVADPDDKQTGSYAAKFSCQWSEAIGPQVTLNSVYSTDSIRAGETYVVSFKYKSLQQTTEATWLNDANYNFLKLYCNLTPAITQSLYPAGLRNFTLDELFGEWLSYEVEFTVPDKKPAYVIRFGITAGNRIVYLDDVKIVKKVTETTNNLIPNGNFEEVDANGKPTGWGDEYASDGESVVSNYNTSDATDFKEGTKSGFFTHDPAYNLDNITPSVYAMNWIENVPADKTYDISFWYKVSDKLNTTSNEPWLNLGQSSFYNGLSSENYAILSTNLDIITGEWLFGEYNGIKSTTATEDFIIGFNGYNCNYWLDDVQMVEATETGITDVKANTKLPVYVSDGILYVGGTTAGETVSVYSITGQALKSEKAQSTTTKITGLSSGQVYIVRSSGKSAKVVL